MQGNNEVLRKAHLCPVRSYTRVHPNCGHVARNLNSEFQGVRGNADRDRNIELSRVSGHYPLLLCRLTEPNLDVVVG